MTDRRIVAIHQPNFFPWLGYFDKLLRCDVFIVMDNAQFSKTGGTWINRVQVMVQGRAAWVTMPVVRQYHGVRKICEMQIDNRAPWRAKLLKTLQMNYARTPYFEEVFTFLAGLIANPADAVVDYNVAAIRAQAAVLGIDPEKLVLGSTLAVSGKATDLVIAMVKAVNGDAYLCGGGAEGYQEDEKFAEAGVEIVYQRFQHPTYHQANVSAFVPGLSMIDALMNLGLDGTRQLLRAHQPGGEWAHTAR